MRRKVIISFLATTAIAVFLAAVAPELNAQQSPAAVTVGDTDIGGVVSGPSGPEAGVWVIAETTDLPTKFARMVVTDDQGRYLIPDLPRANYQIWVRGYGLVDSPKQQSAPGRTLNLTAVPAPDDKTAAQYYPAIYWYSMLKIPAAEEFGKRDDIPPQIRQSHYLNQMKNNGCIGCHQLGQLSTRTIPKNLGEFKSSEEAWQRRISSGQSGESMVTRLASVGHAPYKYFGDWTDRIANGELPHTKPKRPEGVERNIVVTTWEWGDPKKYLHDLIASDRRYPTVNAYGPLFGQPEYSTDMVPILDPKTYKVSTYKAPVMDPNMPESLGPGHAADLKPTMPSPYWGEEKIWDTRANHHNAMYDKDGKLWIAASVRGMANPDWCKQGSNHPSAKVVPLDRSGRQLAVLDPKTMDYKFVDTCFGTHHVQFGYDADNTVWVSGSGPVVGWVNTKVFWETGDAAKAQGWAPFVLDTNGNGKLDEFVAMDQPVDPAKDKRVNTGFYAVMPHPTDGSIWGAQAALGPAMVMGTGTIIRFDPKTGLSEVYNVPAPGFGVRGADIDKKGVIWASLASGHLGSFDRSKCKVLNGPTATGDHCPEGWTFHQYPGPGFKGLGENSAESSYYTWVDQHNTFGLGENVPIATGNNSDSLNALVNGKWMVIRIPYPLSFYAKNLDGRIDDMATGWKGRGLWSQYSGRSQPHLEGGKGQQSKVVHVQYRPDPLAH